MKRVPFALAVLLLGSKHLLGAGDPVADAVARAKLEAANRLVAATTELGAKREQIGAERGPLEAETRQLETKLSTLEAEIQRLETDHAHLADTQRRLHREAENGRRQLAYLLGQAQEGLRALGSNLPPGERGKWGAEFDKLRQSLDGASARDGTPAALAAVDFLSSRLRSRIGGMQATGQAVRASDRRLLDGTFLLMGPETLFRAENGEVAGMVTLEEGSDWPVVHPLRSWSPERANAVFSTGAGMVPLDAAGGKALVLQQRQSTFLDQVRKGGVVGYVILGVGLLAIVIAIQKLIDFRRLGVDEPLVVRPLLGQIAAGQFKSAETAVLSLKATTRELFLRGLKHREKPKAILEEHLESYVLQQRMLQERRLPLLAVIATSGPLLGLLGTVTGMIKTFTLITVFGSGSAGKLSAGISEALVATKFGLMVAIPALVVHGFLSQRIQKHLAMLERYALELVTANEESRHGSGGKEGPKQ